MARFFDNTTWELFHWSGEQYHLFLWQVKLDYQTQFL